MQAELDVLEFPSGSLGTRNITQEVRNSLMQKQADLTDSFLEKRREKRMPKALLDKPTVTPGMFRHHSSPVRFQSPGKLFPPFDVPRPVSEWE